MVYTACTFGIPCMARASGHTRSGVSSNCRMTQEEGFGLASCEDGTGNDGSGYDDASNASSELMCNRLANRVSVDHTFY
jgi:hypothetical protein